MSFYQPLQNPEMFAALGETPTRELPTVRLETAPPSELQLAVGGIRTETFVPIDFRRGEIAPSEIGRLVLTQVQISTPQEAYVEEVITVDTGTHALAPVLVPVVGEIVSAPAPETQQVYEPWVPPTQGYVDSNPANMQTVQYTPAPVETGAQDIWIPPPESYSNYEPNLLAQYGEDYGYYYTPPVAIDPPTQANLQGQYGEDVYYDPSYEWLQWNLSAAYDGW